MTAKKYRVSAFILSMICISVTSGYAQPYFDVAGIYSWYIPAELGTSEVSEISSTAFVALPVDVGKRDKVIFCPLFETRWVEYEKTGDSRTLSSLTMLLAWRHESKDSSWVLTTTFLPRTNASNLSVNTTTLQPGAAVINTFRINPALKLKFGLYYNTEYFGGYFIPLAGIDWKINDRWNLFGVLPNAMKLEYKITKAVYTGLSFKTITNSYRYKNEQGYLKIEDNHLCAFADFYLPGKITLMAEAGHTLLKKFESRNGNPLSAAGGNSLIFKAGIFYRIRMD